MSDSTLRVGAALPALVQLIDDRLAEATGRGERIAFALVLNAGTTLMYASNLDRLSGMGMLASVVESEADRLVAEADPESPVNPHTKAH